MGIDGSVRIGLFALLVLPTIRHRSKANLWRAVALQVVRMAPFEFGASKYGLDVPYGEVLLMFEVLSFCVLELQSGLNPTYCG